jgi:excisionase family DNA binding protein
MSDNSSHKQGLLSEREAAARLGISRITLLRMRAANRISFFRIGTRVLFSEDHLRAFLEGVERRAGERRKVS